MPASFPCTSILPRVETSHTPALTAHRRHFAVHRILGLLAPFRVVKRAKPGPGLDEHRPLLHGVSVRRRKPGGAEVGAAVMAGKSADGDGREGRPEGRGADRADIAPGDGSEHRRAIDIADLALIGRHAERGIALEMLGDAKALAHGKLHVGHRHVVLEIDEGLAPALVDLPHRACHGAFIGRGARACC